MIPIIFVYFDSQCILLQLLVSELVFIMSFKNTENKS